MKAVVDQNTCVGCGLCPQICPDVFRMDGDKAAAYVDMVPAEHASACTDAAAQCPVDAITVQ